MELRDALRQMRSEIGLTQAELAGAINVGFSAVSRWENKNTRPNKAASIAILNLAKKHCVSSACLDSLNEILLASRAKDREERELAEEVSRQLKIEQHELLTSKQLKETIDNLDFAIIGHRIYTSQPGEIQIFYYNERYAEIFGYSMKEFAPRSRENIYFSVPKESKDIYKSKLSQLLKGTIELKDFTMVIQAEKKNDEELWLEIKGISLSKFSYGYELFISCRDITDKIILKRMYDKGLRGQDIAEKMLNTIFDIFFDYIGLIDVASETLESYYTSGECFRNRIINTRNYPDTCNEKLEKYCSVADMEHARSNISLDTVVKMLDKSRFHSVLLNLKDYDGSYVLKRISYTYLDEHHKTIIIAQSDRDNVEEIIETFRGKILQNMSEMGMR